MRCELWSISSAVTGRNVCAMRMAHNKKVSPAAHATTILHLFMQCEAIDIGRNSELEPRPEVIPVMISAARRSSSRLRLECRGAWRYGRRRAGRLRDRRDTSLQRGGQSAMASNRGQGAWRTPVRSVEHLTEWRGDGPSGPPQAFVLELWVGRAERGQRRAEGPLSGWIKIGLDSYIEPDNCYYPSLPVQSPVRFVHLVLWITEKWVLSTGGRNCWWR